MGTESLYYITDYSGNYYRTDKSDQLVSAAGEQDATIFTFAQANKHITGKKAAFYCMLPVSEEAVVPAADESVSPVRELTYEELPEQVDKSAFTYDLSKMNWAEYLNHFIYIVSGLNKYHDELSKQQSDAEKKICDILHYIELCETNEEEAIDLVELLRVCRENRREIKDEIHRIEYFQSNLGTSANAGKAKQALNSMKGLETRKYRPRKYDELFENCIMKERRLRREDIVGIQESQENKSDRFDPEQEYESESRENVMAEERHYTPYDGKENDWLAFARTQAEFYRNAGQYICNLQLDIREIDAEVEEVLLAAEDANCNVAQGYKFFKRLKELRLERKAKTRELQCLYALTDDIACEPLADVCKANLAEIERILEVAENKAEGHAETDGLESDNMQRELHVLSGNIQDMVG